LEKNNFQYIVAAKLRGLPNKLKEQILNEENYEITLIKDELAWVGEFDYKGRRLIASYKTRRAERDNKKREEVVKKIRKQLGSERGETKKAITNQGIKVILHFRSFGAFVHIISSGMYPLSSRTVGLYDAVQPVVFFGNCFVN
jgi:hypothetical protein